MNKNIIETLIGFLVIAVAIYFSFFAYNASNKEVSKDSYSLNINFDRVDGLKEGSLISISGLTIGSVSSLELDPKTYLATAVIAISNEYKIPADSSAEVISAGLLGDKYIAIVPGGSDDYLQDGDLIKYAQGSISIEGLVGKFMFGGAGDEADDSSDEEKSVSPENDFF